MKEKTTTSLTHLEKMLLSVTDDHLFHIYLYDFFFHEHENPTQLYIIFLKRLLKIFKKFQLFFLFFLSYILIFKKALRIYRKKINKYKKMLL